MVISCAALKVTRKAFEPSVVTRKAWAAQKVTRRVLSAVCGELVQLNISTLHFSHGRETFQSEIFGSHSSLKFATKLLSEPF